MLGKGSFGEVHKAEKDGKHYAVKKIDETKMAAEVEQLFANSISASLNSVFLVRYIDKFRTPDGMLYLVMELCEKGDLRTRIEKLKEIGGLFTVETVVKIFIQIVLGLDTLHTNKFLHRDLKPENVYVDKQDNTKLGDFGCAKELNVTGAVASTMIGTPAYESPQVVQGQKYGASADMWALGVLLYEMCTLEKPFSAPNIYLLHQAIVAGKYKEIPPGRVPGEIVEIIRSLLSLDPKKRPSTRDLLRNSFLQKYAAQVGYDSSKALLSWFPPDTLDGGGQTAANTSSSSRVLPSFPSALPPSPIQLQLSSSSIAPAFAAAAAAAAATHSPITVVPHFLATPKAIVASSHVDFVKNYTILELLGNGSYGEVFKCTKDGREYAIKQQIEEDMDRREIEKYFAVSSLGCKFLVQHYEHFVERGKQYVVMELCEKGDLRQRINDCERLELSPHIPKIMIQLVLGLEVLHHIHILHRDLKPENVFVDRDNNIKIGDFGCAILLEETLGRAQTVVGTRPYMPPEIVRGEEDYDSSADMWSLGVLLYELCMLKRPFMDENPFRLNEMIKKGDYKPIPDSRRCPAEISSVIYSLLSMNPKERPTAEGLLLHNIFIRKQAEELGLFEDFPPHIKRELERNAVTDLVEGDGDYIWMDLE